MQFSRRRFLKLTMGAAALCTASHVKAQSYPSRSVHLLIGFAAGASPDVDARLISQSLSERLGQSVIVVNKPGAGNNIATEAVTRASPDGYTLLYVTTSNAINATLYENLNFNFLNDIVPIASIQRLPLLMVVNPSLPAETGTQFLAYAKANPGKVSQGSAGSGTVSHLAGELFKSMSGINMIHVAYRGGGGLINDLMGGQVQVGFLAMTTTIGHIRSGKLRVLGVTGAKRHHALPDVPAIGEFVHEYEAMTWEGLGAPRNTPRAIIEQLNRETNAALADEKLSARFRELGGEPTQMSPAQFGKFIADETDKWRKVIRTANIKLD
jgi:tripartite-type tricarboxylate transporter receptor subunit TctC